MTRICAWCQTEMPSQGETFVTHGICEDCANRMIGDVPHALQEYLEDLAIPVVVVDSDSTGTFSNRAARERSGQPERSQAEGSGRDIYTCIYAKRPEGCAREIHCSGCAIRRSVIATADTGEPQIWVPATLKYGDLDDPSAIALRITTLRQGDVVLLRIERQP